MTSGFQPRRRWPGLALLALSLCGWVSGCGSQDAAFSSGVRIDQLVVRDVVVTVTGTTARITWLSREAVIGRLQFGPTPSFGTALSETAAATQHELELTGLTPATLYYYQIEGSRRYQFQTLGGARGRVAFVSDRSGGRREVFIAYDWLENAVQVSSGGGHSPALSRDGTRLAWVADDPGGRADLWRATVDSAGIVAGSPVNVTATATRDEQQPDWSPDGAQLVFVATAGGVSQLVLRDVATSAETVLFTTGATIASPTWRPTAGQIAFSTTARTALVQLSARPVTPGSVEVAINHPTTPQVLPGSEYELVDADQGLLDLSGSSAIDRDISIRYTSGGTTVVDQLRVPLAHFELFRINADGTDLRRLTSSNDHTARLMPTWHPTSALLVFCGESGTVTNLMSVAADGSGIVGITGGANQDRDPSVAPDGLEVICSSNRNPDGLINLWRTDLAGRLVEVNLFSSAETDPSWSVVP